MPPTPDSIRLDKWLWSSRFFKTRALAAQAIDIGRVLVNDDRVKPAKTVRVGDKVVIRRPPFEQVVIVQALSAQRGPASVAQGLYQETPESVSARESLAAQLRATGGDRDAGRPSKRDRRELERWRQRDG